MLEDLKKNFILLSKVAKEKKYAQEYLGLLARRGDLGSIRIGKRWYTSQEWFSEFLEDAKKRKEEAARSLLENSMPKISDLPLASLAVQPVSAELSQESGRADVALSKPITEVEKEMAPKQKSFVLAKEKIDISVAGNVKEYVSDYSQPETPSGIKVKIPETAKRREISPERISMRPMDFIPASKQRIPLKKQEEAPRAILNRLSYPAKKISRDIDLKNRIGTNSQAKLNRKIVPRLGDMSMSSRMKNREQRGRNNEKMPIFHRVLEVRKSDNMFSPSFSERSGLSSLFFPKLAFGMAAVVLCLLLFQVAAFHKNDLMKMAGFKQDQGIVAGASDEKKNGIKDVKTEAEYYLSSSSDAMKESISFSKLMVRTALERNNNQ